MQSEGLALLKWELACRLGRISPSVHWPLGGDSVWVAPPCPCRRTCKMPLSLPSVPEPGAGRVVRVLCLGSVLGRSDPHVVESGPSSVARLFRRDPVPSRTETRPVRESPLFSLLQILEAVLRSCIVRWGCPRAPWGPNLRHSGPTCRRHLPFSGRSRPPAPSPAVALASGGTGRETGP